MSASRGPRAISLALVFALLALLASAVVKLATNEALPGPSRPEIADPEQPIEAWVALRNGAPARSVRYRLTALYTDPARQAFEAAALRARLGLAEGEPYRLTRTRDPLAADGPALSERPVVRDEHGQALAPIPASVPGDGPADPIRTLFSTPVGIERGGAREWILWGRAPHGAAELALDDGHCLALTQDKVRRADLEVPMAHLERAAAAGKNAGAAASKPDREPQD